jgi:hypothetical protein
MGIAGIEKRSTAPNTGMQPIVAKIDFAGAQGEAMADEPRGTPSSSASCFSKSDVGGGIFLCFLLLGGAARNCASTTSPMPFAACGRSVHVARHPWPKLPSEAPPLMTGGDLAAGAVRACPSGRSWESRILHGHGWACC